MRRGQINDPGLAQIANKIPPPPKDTFATNATALIRDLNRAGLTTAGIAGCPQEARPPGMAISLRSSPS